MSTSKISALFTTISGLCVAIGGAQAFQVFGESSPLGHKVTAGVMLIGIVFAYLANSPLFKPAPVVFPAAPAGPIGKVGAIVIFFALLGAVSGCAHVQPIAACATDVVVKAIEDALTKPDWEAELTQLAIDDGPAVVECVVEQIIAQVGENAGSDVKVAHAKAWKAKHSK